jgi:hypothetical protein
MLPHLHRGETAAHALCLKASVPSNTAAASVLEPSTTLLGLAVGCMALARRRRS